MSQGGNNQIESEGREMRQQHGYDSREKYAERSDRGKRHSTKLDSIGRFFHFDVQCEHPKEIHAGNVKNAGNLNATIGMVKAEKSATPTGISN